MEAALVGQVVAPFGAQVEEARKLFCNGDLAAANPPRVSMVAAGRVAARSRAIRAVVTPRAAAGPVDKKAAGYRSVSVDGTSPQLFVGLPLNAVSDCNTINNAKAIAAGLRPLKLLGVDGVDLPIWWGVAEKDSMGTYNWSGYLAVAEMIRAAGLQARISLCFHSSNLPSIPLPSWVSSIGDANPDIYFTDKDGKRQKECLSLAVDDLPVLHGKTPLEVYENFCRSFFAAFSDYLGSTITDISIGLGPGGELRYPSVPAEKKRPFGGVGEFQCYDKNMLEKLKERANGVGNPLWGLGGPHDAPRYEQTPDSGCFFRENGGSWETPYGEFFLSWYSGELLAHGDRMLSMANGVFGGDRHLTISGKVPSMHAWYKTRSHAAELTAGYYNTERRDGYEEVAKMFARRSCRLVVPGMEMVDRNQPWGSRSSPESLQAQIAGACRKHGVRVAGENCTASAGANGFERIKGNMLESTTTMVEAFTYQRMGVHFFSPEHWPHFVEFVKSMHRGKLDADDLPPEKEADRVSLGRKMEVGSSMEAQAA